MASLHARVELLLNHYEGPGAVLKYVVSMGRDKSVFEAAW
jgi:hypothetical protein